MGSSYRSNRLGLSHWDPYVMHRGGCLKLYYCNMVEWFWWDSSLISTTIWFNCRRTYNVLSGTLSKQSTNFLSNVKLKQQRGSLKGSLVYTYCWKSMVKIICERDKLRVREEWWMVKRWWSKSWTGICRMRSVWRRIIRMRIMQRIIAVGSKTRWSITKWKEGGTQHRSNYGDR